MLCISSAVYAADYSLSINAANGTVETELISGQEVSEGLYQEGSKVKLIAHADVGYRFSGWAGDVSGTLNFPELTMDGNKALTANFTSTTGAVVNMTEDWFTAQGQPPYLLTQADTTYVLQNDIIVDATAFVVGAANVILDLNGYTVTYGNSTPITVTNAGFEEGSGRDVPGWDLSGAPNAAIAPNTNYLWGNQVLRFTNITGTETITSDLITIPFANHEYAATITPRGPWGSTVRLFVIDTVTGATLASANSEGVGRAASAVAQFIPTTINPVRLRIEAGPGTNGTATIVLDYAALRVSRDYGVVASRYYYYLPAHLRSATIDAACSRVRDFAVRNGRVIQGQGRGRRSSPMFVQGVNGLTAENLEIISAGLDTNGIDGSYSGNVAVRNSLFRSAVDHITDRARCESLLDFPHASNIRVEGCRLIDAPQASIRFSGGANVAARNNIIEPNTIVTNGYGILMNGVHSFEVSGNRITAPTGKSGRGILLDGVDGEADSTSSDGEIFGNYVDIRERPNPEYGQGGLEATALRLRSYYEGGHRNIHIHDNTFIARTGVGEVHAAIGARISYHRTNNNWVALNNLIENNLFKAIVETTDTYYWARAMTIARVMDTDGGCLLKNNTFESNDISLGFSDNDGNIVNSGTFISNTIRKSSEGAARNYRSVLAGYWIGEVHNIRLIDMRYENGATTTIAWEGSGTKDLSTGWLLDTHIQNSQGYPLQGATLTIQDKDSVQVFSGASDISGNIADTPVVTTIYRQEGADPRVITTDTRIPHYLEASLSGYNSVAQDIFLTASAEITLTLEGGAAILPGDVNADGVVNVQDLILVARDFGKSEGFNPACDLVADNVINIQDLLVVARNFGRT